MVTLRYNLEKETPVTIGLYDMTGRQVAMPVQQLQAAGMQEYHFKATDYKLPQGLYLVKLSTPAHSELVKLSLIAP